MRFGSADDDATRAPTHSEAMSIDATMPRVRARTRIALYPTVRRAVLTMHIVAGVGLLGDVGAVLAVNIRAATTADPHLAAASYELLTMFTVLFGIPLSLLAPASGVLLGLASPWGVLRYGWVIAKLVLLRTLDRAATERSGDEPAGRGSGEPAERMLLVPSGITHHLDVLEPAGLVVLERRGRCVLVHRTVLGTRLPAL